MPDMSDRRRYTLINICSIAQKFSDLGTLENVANQRKNAERPDDIVPGDQ